jgi:SAM-dependent methyltransferase
MNRSDPTHSKPPAVLTWAAAQLESKLPRTVGALRHGRDRSLGWRDSFAYRGYPYPGKPYGARYWRNHRQLVRRTLSDPALIARFRDGDPLPAGYGVGVDERAVEFPWVLARAPAGRVLDAGSALNHGHVLDALLPVVDELTISTLAPEARSFPEQGVSYVYADLRALPFRDDWFDDVVSISTLEHVGMDVARWGADSARAPDPRAELDQALSELRRVARPGGRLLVTVPYGVKQDMGWLRQFDREEVELLIASLSPSAHEVTVFAYDRGGWRRSSMEAARDARYQVDNRPAGDPEAEDLAAAARAVACLELRL